MDSYIRVMQPAVRTIDSPIGWLPHELVYGGFKAGSRPHICVHPSARAGKSEAEDTIRLMVESKEIENPANKFTQTLNAAARMPGVRIDRAAYLRAALSRHCTDEQVERAIAGSPASAGVPPEVITSAANDSIRFETTKVTALSTASGIPGGFAVIGTIPADIAQYFGHVLRIAQKLAYIYSWPDLFGDDPDEIDDSTEGILTLFVGVMFGVQLAQAGVARLSTIIAAQIVKKLPQQALTKGAIFPVVRKVATYLGIRLTKQLFASGVAKFVPLVGAALSGGLTLATFLPMSKRLQKHLASLELTKPGHRVAANEGMLAEAPSEQALSEDETR